MKNTQNVTKINLVDLLAEKPKHNLRMLIFYETSFAFPPGIAEAYRDIRRKAMSVVINYFHQALYVTFYYHHRLYLVY